MLVRVGLVLAATRGCVALIGCQSAHQHAKGEECYEQEALTDASASTTKATAKPQVAHFGPAHTMEDAKTIPVAKVLAAADQYKDQQVRITGKVTQVCVKKGCWLRVA